MSSRTSSEIIKLIRYSESLNSKVSEDSREALRSLINQGEAIGHLVRYYSSTQSFRALDLLCRIREPHDAELCNCMQECLGKNPLATIILLGQIVQKSPSWLTKICEHQLFIHFLKLLKTTNDTVIMVGGLLFITSLLPHCSTLKSHLLSELFRILLTACSMLNFKKKAVEKDPSNTCLESIHVSHLYCAVIQYFVVLYGIYPNNLLEFLREYAKHSDPELLALLEPVFGVVKFHPSLVKMTAEQELGKERWSHREAHDFSADCRHVLVRPLVEKSNVIDFTSSNQSESSAAPLNFHEFGPKVSSSHSSSNCQSNDSRWSEARSPSINLGLETPPGTRSATPVTQKNSLHSSGTIVPNNTKSLQPTEGSEDGRKTKRGSFSQKFVDLVRGRRGGNPAHSKEIETPHFSLPAKLEATKEETGDIEIIDAVTDNKSYASLGSHVEEGIDASEARGSPSSTLSRDAKIDPVVFGIDENEPHSSGSEKKVDSFSLHSTSTPIVGEELVSCVSDRFPTLADGNSDSLFQVKDDGNEGEESTFLNEDAGDSYSNRFSVTSFFRTVNRQRFISECPPKTSQVSNLSDNHRRKRVGTSTNSRSRSCPDMYEEDELQGSSQSISVVGDTKKSSAQVVLSTPNIASLIEKEFPYLTLLRTLPYPAIDENAMDAELKREHDRTRELYMMASLEHHKTLKRMYLADRIPAKIYDDMSNMIQGMPLEKQREILISRLALVNQHLMYERCGRLLHAERSRRIFGRIKQQKLSEVQVMTLQEELHAARIEREDLVNGLIELRREAKSVLKKQEESEALYREQLRKLNAEADEYRNEMDLLKDCVEKITADKEKLLKEANALRRRCEDAEVLKSLAELKVSSLENLRVELQKAHEANQILRDKLALNDLKAKKQGTGVSSALCSSESNERALMSQVEKLRKISKEAQNANELLKAKKAEIDEECKAEKEKVRELKTLLERAALVHKQQSDAAEHKYLSLLSVCEKQQTHILELCAFIEQQTINEISTSSDGKVVSIPRGTVPEVILSYDGTAGSENATVFTDVFLPEESAFAASASGYSPDFSEDQT